MIEKKKTVIGRVRTGNLRMYICADALANLSYYDDCECSRFFFVNSTSSMFTRNKFFRLATSMFSWMSEGNSPRYE